jgi:hypothetical protein
MVAAAGDGAAGFGATLVSVYAGTPRAAGLDREMIVPRQSIRCTAAGLVLAVLTASNAALAGPQDPLEEMLLASLNERKGVMLYIAGQSVPGRVTKFTAETVELTSQQFGRIVVRRDRIDAVAGN